MLGVEGEGLSSSSSPLPRMVCRKFPEEEDKNPINAVGSTSRKNAQQKYFEHDKIWGSKTGKTQGLMHTIWSLEMDTYNLKLITVCLILDI